MPDYMKPMFIPHTGRYLVDLPYKSYGTMWTMQGVHGQLRDWLNEQVPGRWSFTTVKVVAWIELYDAEAAMLFKLRWS